MNPLTDKISFQVVNNIPLTIVQPGGKLVRSTNWRLNEKMFRSYEGHIRTAIENWPAETKFDIPAGMSVNTFEHRLRDAMQALKLFGYDPELQRKLADLRTELVVSMDPSGSCVWIREKLKRGRQIAIQSTTHQRMMKAPMTVQPPPTLEVLKSFLTLGVAGHRPDPVHFKGRIDQAWQDQLTVEYDTAFVYDDTTDTTIML